MTANTSLRERLDASAAAIRARDARTPDVALVLGSGLGAFADTLADATAIPYADIPHTPPVTVPGHAGKLVLGTLPNAPAGVRSPVVAALAGRAHLYEGHSPSTAVYNVRLMIHLGAKVVLLTNAAGAVSPTLTPGDFVLLTDHINLQACSPLTGPNEAGLGPRFPDMTHVYDPGLRARAKDVGERIGVPVREGVYAALQGPSYETPAEIRMLRVLGADLVGMSTVPEAVAARHMGARVLGISCVTNLAAGVSPAPLSHDEVEDTARRARGRFVALLEGILAELA